MTTELFLRLFLPLFWTAYLTLAYVLPLRTLRRDGVEPEAVAAPDAVMEFGERARDLIFALVLLLAAVHAVRPSLLAHLGRLPLLEAALVTWIGVALLIASLILMRAGQRHLGRSWRIGFDPHAAPPALIVTGIYRWSRNPIYSGMLLSAFGYFLVLPNALTFGILAAAVVLMQVRVRVEERWLHAAHGAAYLEYCERTPRWLIRKGRVQRLAPKAHAAATAPEPESGAHSAPP
jgi:protein-S-isoprenylcysteine O-methyltransferase Ste14